MRYKQQRSQVNKSSVPRNTVIRQRLTHFLKILENFKIPKTFGGLRQNPQFFIKIIFWVTLIFYRYRIVLILIKNYGKKLQRTEFYSKMSIFGPKNFGKIQLKIGTPKIDTPKIDAFFKFWALLKCVNLWRRTVYSRELWSWIKHGMIAFKAFPKL